MGPGFRRDDRIRHCNARRDSARRYILASRRNGTLYIGVTSDLCSRIAQHKEGSIPGFTKKYDVKILVWYQYFDAMAEAIEREKQMKEWKRGWKIKLIQSSNPDWRDLYAETCGAFLA